MKKYIKSSTIPTAESILLAHLHDGLIDDETAVINAFLKVCSDDEISKVVDILGLDRSYFIDDTWDI